MLGTVVDLFTITFIPLMLCVVNVHIVLLIRKT
jgi:hypothetical protein